MPTPIEWDVYARDRASRTFNTVGSSADRSGGLIKKFGVTVAGVFTGAALYSGVTRLARGLADLTENAADDAQAQSRLALQYRNSADASNTAIAATESWISAQGEALGVSDDELRPALTRLVTATEDVAEAQELGGLAMEVAAGKQKSLASVSEALARGADGNTAALGRLGVKTKDASGEALTFQEITANLAKTFAGQASQAANTAAGSYQRLKVRFSEAGEEIGYKLLPHAVDLGNWMLDEGIPAAEGMAREIGDELGPVVRDLAGWVRDNRDELADFGGEMRDTVVPILRTTAEVGGEVVDFFMALPAPVRELAVQAGVAAIALPRITNAVQAMALPSFIGNLSSAETRTLALGRAARTAAGVGGVLALVDSAGQSNEALGALEKTLGGAAVGFSLGGPWGALAGGTLGGLHSAFTLMFQDVEQTGVVMTDGKASVEDYASTFDHLSGAITGSTRNSVLHAAQVSGVLGQIDDFGISQRQLINAVLGQKGALDAVNVALQKSKGLTIAYTDAWGGQHVMAVKNKKQADQLTTSLVEQGNTIDDVRSAGLDLAASDAISDFIGNQTKEWKSQSKAQREAIMASQDLTSVYRTFPKNVATKIDATGIVPTTRGVANLAIKYDAMDKREIAALIKATGTEMTVAQVQRVIDKMNEVKSKTVDITVRYNEMGGPGRDNLRIGAGYGSQATNRAEFAGSFGGFQSSIFGMTTDEPLTVDSILAQGAAEQAKAEQTKADLAKLVGMGLSPALIKQFQSQGPSGLAALRALASGANAEQIAMLNAQNVATQSAYGGVGEIGATALFGSAATEPGLGDLPFGGHGPRGGKGGKGVSKKDLEDASYSAMSRALGELKLETKLTGSDIRITLRAHRRDRGGGPLGFDN